MMKNLGFLVLTALVSAVGALGCSTGPKSVQGEYQVTGSTGVTSASVTYALPPNSNSSAVSVTLPWSYSFTGYETQGSYAGTNVYLSAQNNSSTGSVTVTITENSRIFQQSWAAWPQAAITVLGNY